MAGRFEATVERVFERMKAVYLHEIALQEAENRPTAKELFAEYQAAVESPDMQAVPNLIASRGQDNFNKQVTRALRQVRAQNRGG